MSATQLSIRLSLTLCPLVSWFLVPVLGETRQVSGLGARHEAGQTLLIFKEVDSPVTQEVITVIRKLDERGDGRVPVEAFFEAFGAPFFE